MYALVDCDNFFVSCERVFQPWLEGKAVVVLSNNDGCAVARSNESKALGIKMGTPFFQLTSLVKSGALEVRSSNYALYGDISARVMSILAESAPKIEVYSIDEAFMVLDGIAPEEIETFCRSVVERVRKWVGIPVSIGVGPTKTLAKLASHFAKHYRGYRRVCMIDSEAKRLKALELSPIGDVWGIGRRLAVRMKAEGIATAAEFAAKPQEWVRSHFMTNGVRVWNELRGIQAVAEELPAARKSICTSRSFENMISDIEQLAVKVADFAAQCASKLRQERTVAGNVTVFLWTNRFREDLNQHYPSATIRMPVPVNNSQDIVSAAHQALRMIYRRGFLYKKAGVIVDDIIEAAYVQSMLFDEEEELRQRNDVLSQVMDKINATASGSGEKGGGVRLAAQGEKHFSDGIRSDHRSRRYTTDFREIMEVRV